MPAAPRLRRPRLPHRSGQCGGAPNAAAASLARQRGGGGPQEAAPPVRVLAGGAGGAGRAAGPASRMGSARVLCAEQEFPRWDLKLREELGLQPLSSTAYHGRETSGML
ncbi:uncharacterized protein LOC107402392 [Peromyscus maniculatus bairdii]|uniref:uncharacterized protein LOC107402392 n=1 Tax=Peromyscus maniculatus bairdii TaxID=230844 RepID=UPI003FD1C038